MVHIDLPAFKIKIDRQAAELGDTEAGSQKNDDLVTILPVDRITRRKSKEAVLLLLGQCDLFLRVILQDRIQSEVERVLADTIIFNRRVEGRLQRPFPVIDRLVGITLFAHSDCPFFRVRQLHGINAPASQWVSFQHRHQILTALFSAPLDILPMAVLLCVELADRHLLPDGVNAIGKVPLDFLHLFPEREVIPFSSRGLVGGDQPPGVHELRFPVCVRIFRLFSGSLQSLKFDLCYRVFSLT